MQLLISPASPYARKVRVLLRETGQLAAVTEVNVTTSPLASAPEVIAANPTGRIPVLIRDDGPAIIDSRVICRFLDARAQAGLYPDSRLWDVLTLEALADGILDSALALTYEARFRPPPQQSPDWMAAQWDKIARAVAVLGDHWISHLSGPLTMGQIAVGCALGYLDLRHAARDWRQHSAMLAGWEARFAQRPSMVETRPPA
jgi:glutathione S-transferase